jgi:BirA family transcriptional regulator, biotin operon repressor / biotin---[acetyl-CoA-carboxylase] ligase
MAAEQVPILQFLTANAVQNAVAKLSGLEAKTKWPNDLVVGSKKLAGMLIETKVDQSTLNYVIVGVGLNVNLTLEQLPPEAASILTATKRKLDLETVLTSILEEFRDLYERRPDPLDVMECWWSHCVHQLKPVTIETIDGLVKGKCTGVHTDGSILIQTPDGNTIRVIEGTLRFEEQPLASVL